jgi:hypothetical protein
MRLEKVNEVRQVDDDFKANGSKRGPGGAGGPPPNSGGDLLGSDLYYILFLGHAFD